MQRRMAATLEKYVSPNQTIISLPAYRARFETKDGELVLSDETEDLQGMWEARRLLSLLMGEIPRLEDDETGYGPNGAGYIAHVEIPAEVTKAFDCLKAEFPELVREANPAYAS